MRELYTRHDYHEYVFLSRDARGIQRTIKLSCPRRIVRLGADSYKFSTDAKGRPLYALPGGGTINTENEITWAPPNER